MKCPREPRIPARSTLVAFATAGLVMLTGCGGASGPDAATYRAKANAICRAGHRTLTRLSDQIVTAERGGDPAVVFREVAALKARQAATRRQMTDRLDLLPTPAAQRERVQAWIADQRRQSTLVEALSRAFARRDETRIATLSQRLGTLDAENDTAARRLALVACADHSR